MKQTFKLALPFLAFFIVSPHFAQAKTEKQGVVLSKVPSRVDRNAHYLFYISGYIVAAGNTRPVSPKFGVYEYQKILEVFSKRGFVVISEARKQSREIQPYAAKVAGDVRLLLNRGVPPQNITVVGASQGSWMAMLVSTYIANRDLNFVFVSGCGANDDLHNLVDLHGNVLFITELTDVRGSCKRFRDDANGLGDYESMEINTGLKHGFLYRPITEWVEPTVQWAKKHSLTGANQSALLPK